MFLALQNLEIKGFVHNLKIREHKLTTFQYEGLEIALIHAYFGAMASLHRLFEYYIRGIEYFIDIAASGSLNSNVKIGDIVRLRFIGAGGSTIFHVKTPGTKMQMVHIQVNDVKPYWNRSHRILHLY